MENQQKALAQKYKKNQKKIDREKKKSLFLEIVVVMVVCIMKIMEETATLKANIAATGLVLLLICIHFWGFYPRRHLCAESANTLLKGVDLEKKSLQKKGFFRQKIKEFNLLGEIVGIAIFDVLLFFFFSISYTQLLKAISPDILPRLRWITPISTGIISISLGWSYYSVVRGVHKLKNEGVL